MRVGAKRRCSPQTPRRRERPNCCGGSRGPNGGRREAPTSRLAQLEIAEREYPDRLWSGAIAYFQGQDYRNAARLLRLYVKNQSRQRRPQALAALGEALLCLGNVDEALAALKECILDFSHDPTAYRARLLASRAYVEKAQFEQAEALLRENLEGEGLTPDSREWRDSLFALGELLHGQGRDAEAIVRLEEAVERYGDLPRTATARYLLADSCRCAAEAIGQRLARETSAARREASAARAKKLFEEALTQHRRIVAELAGGNDARLTAVDKATLRNSRFAIGEVCSALGRYEEAAKAYAAAATAAAGHAESLDAYVRLAETCRRMGRSDEARDALQRAKTALARMGKDARFDETTNHDRKEWDELLKMEDSWLSSPSGKGSG